MKSLMLTRRWARLALAYAALLVFLMVSDPQQLPSFMLIIPFLILFIALYLTLVEGISLLRAQNESVVGMRLGRPRVIAALVAAFPVLLLVLKSIGQLSIWDIITAAAVFVVAYIYLSRSAVTLFR